MLFYPFEKQLFLPTIPIELGDGQGRYVEVVSQEYEQFVGFCIIEFYATKFDRIKASYQEVAPIF